MPSSKHQPHRTCIGCRGNFPKGDLVRIVAVQGSIIVDYRGKLQGRAVYVCARTECIRSGIKGAHLSRLLRTTVRPPDPTECIERIESAVREKIRSLIGMAAKSDACAVGFSAVQDALEKGRVALLIGAADLADGSRGRLGPVANSGLLLSWFTKQELGGLFGRETVGMIGIQDRRIADAVEREFSRLKGLLNAGE